MTFRDWGQIGTVNDKIKCEGANVQDEGKKGKGSRGKRVKRVKKGKKGK